MVHVSNSIVCILNFIYLLVAILFIAFSVLLKATSTNDCQRYVQWSLIVLGLCLLTLCLLGIFGSCCRINFFLWLYLFFMFLLIIVVLAATVFTIMVTNSAGLKEVTGMRVFEDYRVGGYSTWLLKTMSEYNNWMKIQECLKQSDICNPDSGHRFFSFGADVKYLQATCCKPPPSCGFTSVNATYWKPPKSMPNDADCRSWSNDDNKLCYDCNSCKGAVVSGFKGEWKDLAISNSALLLFLVVMYSVGCCAYRNNRARRYDRYQGYE